jgi:phosphohistidine phosphatase
MKLYIVRHAIATERGAGGLADEERPLTEEGIEKMKVNAAGLRKLGVKPDRILSSPLVRARQTAAILADAFGERKITVTPALSPAGTLEDVYAEIRKHSKCEALMLVGHQPSLGELAGALAWGSPQHYVELKKGGVCALDVDRLTPQPRGKAVFLLPPAVLRRLAD